MGDTAAAEGGDRQARERDAFYRDPHPIFARARRTPGLTYLPLMDAWLVSRYADVLEVLRRPDDFSSANALTADVPPSPAVLAELSKGMGGGRVVLSADGEAHQRLRAPLVRGLSAAKVAALVPYIAERAEALVAGFADDGRTELMAAYARRLPGDVIGRLLGLDPDDVPSAVDGSKRAEALLFRPLPPDEQIAAAKDVVALQHRLAAHIRRTLAEPRDDLGGELVRALGTESGEPTGELVSNLQNLFIAGHLTTTALIGTTVLRLLSDRSRWETLCARPELIPAAVEEAARHDTAIQAFRRVTTRPLTLAGTALEKGTAVLVAYGSANRDESRYERAAEFDLERTPSRHLAFGHGAHGCPGAQLAREQLRITLETLTTRLPGLRLAPGPSPAMTPTLIHRSPEMLHLIWH
ncbi:cytochrome P450 [Spongiactinospora sp. TRM90649]|uniref:cytochrome P450 n=1 Tax=Spongiactinospora sp. TRM90649 TaxID=3031114 RepID=UPI0023F9A764|nr:cytochrome P450 [Spongiactinospora sp. TRM90649]MDF5755282.1 cytochrome P450 [Spongiactinospora sp. TRM90649]